MRQFNRQSPHNKSPVSAISRWFSRWHNVNIYIYFTTIAVTKSSSPHWKDFMDELIVLQSILKNNRINAALSTNKTIHNPSCMIFDSLGFGIVHWSRFEFQVIAVSALEPKQKRWIRYCWYTKMMDVGLFGELYEVWAAPVRKYLSNQEILLLLEYINWNINWRWYWD